MVIIVSGGQTGVDRAALDAAIAAGLPYRGWCPKGGWAEDMPAPLGLRSGHEEPGALRRALAAFAARIHHPFLGVRFRRPTSVPAP